MTVGRDPKTHPLSSLFFFSQKSEGSTMTEENTWRAQLDFKCSRDSVIYVFFKILHNIWKCIIWSWQLWVEEIRFYSNAGEATYFSAISLFIVFENIELHFNIIISIVCWEISITRANTYLTTWISDSYFLYDHTRKTKLRIACPIVKVDGCFALQRYAKQLFPISLLYVF